ncbi:MAG: neprosin family prolyl endopeptidase [Candidatus Marithrix sp.]
MKNLLSTISIASCLFFLFQQVLAQDEIFKANPKEVERMESYLEELYRDTEITHQFLNEFGQLISCVDIYTQPAFRHSALRNHEIQLRPSSELLEKIKHSATERNTQQTAFLPICPENSIPMRIYTVEDLARFKSLEDFKYKKSPSFLKHGSTTRRQGPTALHQYAVTSRNVNNIGSRSTINIWAPYVQQNNEFSLSQIWLVGGTGSNLETLEVGWQVYPDRNGDSNSHLFIYFTPDNYGSGGCYDLTCSGFIQTNTTIAIGATLTSSVIGGTQTEGTVAYWRDSSTGHWWLVIEDIMVGYYPTSLFDTTGIKNNATRVDYGGEILDRQTGGLHTGTDMGNGQFPVSGNAAYQRSLEYMDTSGTIQPTTSLTALIDDSLCYDLVLDSNATWGQFFNYGGRGYHNPNCE